jgi:TolB protein
MISQKQNRFRWEVKGMRNLMVAMLGCLVGVAILSSLLIGQSQISHQLRQLTDHPAPDYSPCWHPDGRLIAFVSEREGGRQIWLVDVTTKRARRLTRTGNNWAPSFSPDGRWIAFISDRAGQPHVWAVRVDAETEPRQLTRYHEDSPAWSPDGSMIAFVSRRTGEPSLWVMNADGSMQRMLVRMPGKEIRHPVWTPDGKRIIFWSNIAGEPSLWEYRIDERSLVQLTEVSGNIEKASCSASGWLTFSAAWTGQWEIWALPLVGGKPTQLTELRRQAREPALSRDGCYLAFVSDISGNLDIWLMETPTAMWLKAGR